MFDIQDLGLVGEGGQSYELHDFMQGMRKEKIALHATFAAVKSACERILLDIIKLWAEKGALKKRIEELTRRLPEERSALERGTQKASSSNCQLAKQS